MANIKNNSSSPNSFKDYLNGKYPYNINNTSCNITKLYGCCSTNSIACLSLIFSSLRHSDDVIECITVSLSPNDMFFLPRKRRLSSLKELSSLNVIKKKNPDNKCTLYLVNPSFINVMNNKQRKEFRDMYHRDIFGLFEPFSIP